MDASWLFMIAIWAFFEFFGFIIKKDFSKRMKIGAISSTLIVSGIMLDSMLLPSINPAYLFVVTFFMYGTVAFIIYFLRLKAAKFSNARLDANKSSRTFTLVYKLTSQLLAIIIGFVISMLFVVVVVGGLYLAAK